MMCPACNQDTAPKVSVCINCSVNLKEALEKARKEAVELERKKPSTAQEVKASAEQSSVDADFRNVEQPYQKICLEFHHNKGRFKASWNWSSFLYGAAWYFAKGMWGKGLLFIAGSLLSFGVLFIPIWFYTGIAGNWDYYLWKVKGKQWWR